jgi:hypothetical protein
VPLGEGVNNIKLNTRTPRRSANTEKVFEFQAEKGETIFHSLESIPVNLN